MNNLQVAKAIAELEGVEVEEVQYYGSAHGGEDYPVLLRVRRGVHGERYDPLDWSILGSLMVKYEVEVDYIGMWTDIAYIGAKGIVKHHEPIKFESKEDIPRAVCECILKANNLGKEK